MKAYPTYTGKKYNVYYIDGTSTEVTFGDTYKLKDANPEGKSPSLYRYIDIDTNRLLHSTGTWNLTHDIKVRSVFGIGFEEVGDYSIVKSAKNCTYTTVDTMAIEGTHSLAITYTQKTDIFVTLEEAFLDEAFEDPNVYSLSFRATAEFTTNNFRHRGTDADHPSMANICYENNQTGFGLVEGMWKTFHFTRENYNVFVNVGYDALFVAGAQNVGLSIYIDDIRTNYIDPKLTCDFETGMINTSGSNWTVRSGAIYPFTTDHIDIQCTNANDANTAHTDVSFNTDITFDFYAENFFSNGHIAGGACDGINGQLGVDLVSGKWITLSIAKSRITSDGRFLIISGSQAVGTCYFDNFRITKGE